MPRQNGAGAVELFEGDHEGEFVLESEGTERPEEVGVIKETFGVTICAADDQGNRAGGLLPLVEFGGQLAAGDKRSVFVEDNAEASFAASQEVGAFAGTVRGFDDDWLDWCELGEARQIFAGSCLGVGEGWFADGEEQVLHAVRTGGEQSRSEGR